MSESKETQVIDRFNELIEAMQDIRGEERSPKARAISIVITLTEQAVAYWAIYVGGNFVSVDGYGGGTLEVFEAEESE